MSSTPNVKDTISFIEGLELDVTSNEGDLAATDLASAVAQVQAAVDCGALSSFVDNVTGQMKACF